MTTIALAGQQLEALARLKEWWKLRLAGKSTRPFFGLYGYAGTGKTTMAKFFLDELGLAPHEVGFVTFTGKASRVVTERTGFNSNTIHSQIYKLVDTPKGRAWVLNNDSPIQNLKVVVADEVSQIGEQMLKDLLSFNVPLILLGDPFQLPPISDKDVINSTPPDYFLTEIHRQALENPIIFWSQEIRNGRDVPYGNHGTVRKLPRTDLPVEEFLRADQILTGTNNTRMFLNRWFRQQKGYASPLPINGDKLICLKNQRKLGLLNGLMATATADAIETGNPHVVKLNMFIEDTEVVLEDQIAVRDHFQSVLDPGGNIVVLDREGFPPHFTPFERGRTSQFTFAYAITVHKAQGSQFKNVVMVDEWQREDRARWLYTAITRAVDEITILT